MAETKELVHESTNNSHLACPAISSHLLHLIFSVLSKQARYCGEKFRKLCDTRIQLFHLLLLGASCCLDIQEWIDEKLVVAF